MNWKLTQPGKIEVHGTCERLVDALLDAGQHCHVGYWHQTGNGFVRGPKANVACYYYTGYLAEADKTTPAARIAELSIREIGEKE